MGTLVLQMQTSLDGFVDARDPDLRWQIWDWGPDWTWDGQLRQEFNTALARTDKILLSRKLAEEGYIDHWTGTALAHPDQPDYDFARRIIEVEKIVVTSRPLTSRWPRTTVLTGDFAELITSLKEGTAGQIMCFGGAGFASALVVAGLVDEFQLYVNPTAVGEGSSIFTAAGDGLALKPIDSRQFPCGITVNRYRPA